MSRTIVRVDVEGAPYDVVVGRGVAGEVPRAVAGHDGWTAIVDTRVARLHGASLPWIAAARALELEGGEPVKELGVLGRVLDHCAERGLSRASTLVALGGGTVGDLSGLAASLFKRGLAVVQVPTTLLAQVDASVGGKTAINLHAGKNLAGTFHQPSAVLCDTSLLATLPDAEYASGLGEVVKTAIIEGESALARLDELSGGLVARDVDALDEIVAACVRTKAAVVAADPDERGRRKVLNLGHTFAHAIEHAAGYGAIPHGVAVGTGLALAQTAAERRLDADPSIGERVRALLTRFDIPGTLADLRARYPRAGGLDPDALRRGLAHDKKSSVGRPRFVLARRPGALDWDVELDETLVAELLR